MQHAGAHCAARANSAGGCGRDNRHGKSPARSCAVGQARGGVIEAHASGALPHRAPPVPGGHSEQATGCARHSGCAAESAIKRGAPASADTPRKTVGKVLTAICWLFQWLVQIPCAARLHYDDAYATAAGIFGPQPTQEKLALLYSASFQFADMAIHTQTSGSGCNSHDINLHIVFICPMPRHRFA